MQMQSNATYACNAPYEPYKSQSSQGSSNLSMSYSMPYPYDTLVVPEYFFIDENTLDLCEEIVPLTLEYIDYENQNVNQFYYFHPTTEVYKDTLMFQHER